MEKNFFQVFPVLQVEADLKRLLSDTMVRRVVSNKERTRLRIYLDGTRLIHKKNIFKLERNIKKQLFPQQELSIKIIEHYQLSAQYTPKTLMDIYKDSILEEMKAYSLLIYNLFRCAKLEFDTDNHMKIFLEDTFLAQQCYDELAEILYKIMKERCGLSVVIEPVFEKKKKKDRQEDEKFFYQTVNSLEQGKEREIADMSDNAREHMPDHEIEYRSGYAAGNIPGQGKGNKKGGEPEKNHAVQKKQESDKSKITLKHAGTEKSFSKRPHNPDVVYGRDFEGDSIAMEEITGEMGEIIVRGKVIEIDTRPLRNGDKTIVIVSLTDFTDTIVFCQN